MYDSLRNSSLRHLQGRGPRFPFHGFPKPQGQSRGGLPNHNIPLGLPGLKGGQKDDNRLDKLTSAPTPAPAPNTNPPQEPPETPPQPSPDLTPDPITTSTPAVTIPQAFQQSSSTHIGIVVSTSANKISPSPRAKVATTAFITKSISYTHVVTLLSTPSTSTSLPMNGSPIHRDPLIAIIGGVCGGLFLLLGLGLLFFCVRRRKKMLNHRAREDWKWFDKWKRRNRSMSLTTVEDIEARPSDKNLLSMQNLAQLTSSPSIRSAMSPTLVASKAKHRFRVVSMGDVTNNTGTTSNTNLVIALPPHIRHLDHGTHQTKHDSLPHLRYYHPSSPKQDIQPHPYPDTPEDILITAAFRNSQLLLLQGDHRRP